LQWASYLKLKGGVINVVSVFVHDKVRLKRLNDLRGVSDL
jgi:hypothetical protein